MELTEPLDWHNLKICSKRFFSLTADIQKTSITFRHTETAEEPFEIVIFYDQNLHGTPKCPYLAYKVEGKDNIVDLDRDDYVTMMKAVD
jgi:hypothetical protein